MTGHNELTKDVDIDIGGLFSNIWKKKWLILILSALAGVAIFFIMNSIAPRYKTSAQLIIEPRESQFTRVQQTNGGINANDFDEAAVLSQVQIILSDEIALNTIKKLELASKPEFSKNNNASIISDLFVLAGLKQSPLDISPDERVLKSFKKRLKAYSIEQSRVIEILFWSNDRKLAKLITNTIADEYLTLQRNAKLETDINATKFLEPEIATLRTKVQAAEARVAEFRANSDILLGNNNALLATQQLSETSTELSRVRSQRSAAQAKVDSVRSTLDIGASLEAIPEVVASPLIQRLRERQVGLRAQISELSTTLLSAHPRLKALKSQVADFENQIRREARGILRGLESNVIISRKQESSLVTELARLKAEAARAGEAEVELRALEREAVAERELLQAYMTKFREAAGRQSSKYIPINARIISGAHLPTESYFPKTIPYTIAGTIVTSILSMVGILFMSLMSGSAFRQQNVPINHQQTDANLARIPDGMYDDRHDNFEKIEASQVLQNIDLRSVTPVDIGETPPLQSEPEFAPIAQDTASVSMIAEGLLGMGSARIAVVSPGGDTGSQSTWILARMLAHAGKTVALLDMTGSGVTSMQMLEDVNLPGVKDVLAQVANIGDVIYRDKYSNVNILPVGVTQQSAGDTAMRRLTSIIEALGDSFDYLIIDCGYTLVENLPNIANAQTVVLISTVGTNEGPMLEAELLAQGFAEAICVNPTNEELISLNATIAA